MGLFRGSTQTYIIVILVNTTGFLCGTSLSWTSPILPKLKSDHDTPIGRNIDDNEESWIGSLTAMGGIFGPFIFGYLADKIGRKKTVALAALPFLVAYLVAAFAHVVPLYYVSRFLMGVGIGGVFTVLPIYIVEIAEDVNRGILSSSTTTFIMFGSLFGYVVGPFVSIMVFNLILSGICLVFIPVWLFVSPETPYYYLKVNKEQEATQSLQYLRRRDSIEFEIEGIQEHLEKMGEPGTLLGVFRSKASRTAFIYVNFLTIFQQFSGIVVIMAYSQTIFDATGSELAPHISAIILGSVQAGTCFITPLMTERAGRRTLLLISTIGATIFLVLFGIYFYFQENGHDVSAFGWAPVLCLVFYILSYNSGFGSLPWGLVAELMPSNVISISSSTTTSLYWFVGFFLTFFFNSMTKAMGTYGCFWLFSGCCACVTLFVFQFIFETKGKSLAEIQTILAK